MDWIVRLPSPLYRLSVKKAGSDRELQAHIRQYLYGWTGADSGQIDGGIAHGNVIPGLVYCPDCQRTHTPGHCARVT